LGIRRQIRQNGRSPTVREGASKGKSDAHPCAITFAFFVELSGQVSDNPKGRPAIMAKQLPDETDITHPHRRSFFDEPESLEALARRQGVKPLNFDELMAMKETWPEEEDGDELIAAVRQWRNAGADRSLP
jgi:hypothetical protein